MTTKTCKATGNTYTARNVLKAAGFVWDKDSKAWLGDDDAKTELARITTASYSRANGKACSGLELEAI